MILPNQAKDRKSTSEWAEEARTQFYLRPHAQVATHSQEGTQNLKLLSLRSKGFEPYIKHPQLLRPASERQVLKTSSFENQWGPYPEELQDSSYLTNSSNKIYPLRLTRPRAWNKNSRSRGTQILCEHDSFVNLKVMA